MSCVPHLSKSALVNRSLLRSLEDLTVPAMLAWIVAPKQNGGRPSNNYVRDRVAVLRLFIVWLIDEGLLAEGFDRRIDWKHFHREYPRVYGKQQSRYPARFLSAEECVRLLDACRDGTWVGSRDQLAIRLGLQGLRRMEVLSLTWGDYDRHGVVIRRPGKRNRMREVRPGGLLVELLGRWQRQYERELGRGVTGCDPLLCGQDRGLFRGRGAARGPRPIAWGQPLGYSAFYGLVQERARQAGLGTWPPTTCAEPPPASSTAPAHLKVHTCTTCSTSSACSTRRAPTPRRRAT